MFPLYTAVLKIRKKTMVNYTPYIFVNQNYPKYLS